MPGYAFLKIAKCMLMNDRLVDAQVKGARMDATDNATYVEAESSAEAKWRRNARRHTRCVMVLPDDLAGKRVLDIECRKGLGAFKIADRVGEGGFVVGTDSSTEKIEVAEELAPQQHWAGDAWQQHMRLVQADPTDLLAAGIDDASIDVVVVNSVLNFAPNRLKAFSEIARVLAPGGYLYHDAVLALQPLPPLSQAGHDALAANVFATAPTKEELVRILQEAGFSSWEFLNEQLLEPQREDAIEALSGLTFESAVVRAFA